MEVIDYALTLTTGPTAETEADDNVTDDGGTDE
jgi:hypothetical protein